MGVGFAATSLRCLHVDVSNMTTREGKMGNITEKVKTTQNPIYIRDHRIWHRRISTITFLDML